MLRSKLQWRDRRGFAFQAASGLSVIKRLMISSRVIVRVVVNEGDQADRRNSGGLKPLAADAPYTVQLVTLACLPQEPCQQENRRG